MHEKVGVLTNKAWTHLLGDVNNGIVDIGLGYITVNDERRRDMCFSHPLIRYTYVFKMIIILINLQNKF